MICPHCLKSVFPYENICPGCQKDVTNTPAHDLVRVEVHPGTQFQPNCHRCDMPTNRQEKLKTWHRTHEYIQPDAYEEETLAMLRIFTGLLGILFFPLKLVTHAIRSKTGLSHTDTKTVIAIPTCNICKNQIRLLEDDPDSKCHTIAASRSFAGRL